MVLAGIQVSVLGVGVAETNTNRLEKYVATPY